MHGDLVDWGVAEHLQATAINDHRVANSGKRSLPDSKLVIPPGTKPSGPAKANGHKPGTADDLKALFDGR